MEKKKATTNKVERKNKPSKFSILVSISEEIKREQSRPSKKKGRDPQWKFFKLVSDILENKQLVGLIIYKLSYPTIICPLRSDKKFSCDNESTGYLYSFFKLDSEQCTANDNRILMKINDLITEIIETLRVLIISGLKWIVQQPQYPKAPLWVFDVFGEDASIYLEDWTPPIRTSKNKPNYRKALTLFKLSLREKYKDIGLIKKKKDVRRVYYDLQEATVKTMKNTGNFSTRTRPQGAIKLLHIAHLILHESPRIVQAAVEKKTRSTFRDMIDSVSPPSQKPTFRE
jgi:hypothetical protein